MKSHIRLFSVSNCNPSMVQQVTDKFNEYKSIHCGSAMPSRDKQHTVLTLKVALRELPNTSDIIISKPAESSPLGKERGPMTDSVKASGTKRKQPDCSSSPSSHQPPANKEVNGHLVYVRRKLETERSKKNTSNNADPLSSSTLSRKTGNEETKEAKVEDKTQECNEIFHPDRKSINGLEPNDSRVIALAPVDPKRPSNQGCKAPVDPQKPSDQDSNGPVDPQKPSSQDCKAPFDPQRPSNQDLNAPVDPQRPSNQDCQSPSDPQRLSNQDCKAPFDRQRPSNQYCKAPVDPQRLSNQDLIAPIDPQRPSNQDCRTPGGPQRPRNQDPNAPVGPQRPRNQDSNAPGGPQRPSNQDPNAPADPQRPRNQDSNAPVDPQRSSNQDSKAPADPQRPSNQDWKERYLQLQVFLKNCDQSSQEDYKRMLRSLTSAGRSRLALELEKRALNLLLEEGKELHRMQVLNIIGEATLHDHASPSTQTSAAQSQFQRMETMHNPKSPFLRNGC